MSGPPPAYTPAPTYTPPQSQGRYQAYAAPQPYGAAPQPYAQPYAAQPQQQPYAAQPYSVQQPYAAPRSQAPPSYGEPAKNESAGLVQQTERFPAPQCRDAVWAVVFIVLLLGWFVFTFSTWKNNILSKDVRDGSANGNNNNNGGSSSSSAPANNGNDRGAHVDEGKMRTLGTICGYLIVIGVVIAVFWLQMIKTFPKQMIYFVLVCNVVFLFAMALFMFATGVIIAGVIFLILGALTAWFYYMCRFRIPFAAEMLRTTVGVVNMYPAMIGFSFLALFTTIVWVFFWVLSVSSIANMNLNGMYILALFLFYWTANVIKNLMHVTAAGTFASWYFLAGTPGMPRNPTIGSFKRATTTSLGSVVLGSLIIAVIQTIRAILRGLQNNNRGGIGAFLAACANCILGCIESLINYFNRYAFTQVAIYGKPFIQAAKDTWEMFKTHGFDAIINDDLTSPVLTFTSILAGLMLALIAFVWAGVALGSFHGSNLGYAIALAVVGFLIGLVECLVMMEVVSSGVAAVFVCFADAPSVLESRDPVLYQRITDTYGTRIGFASTA